KMRQTKTALFRFNHAVRLVRPYLIPAPPDTGAPPMNNPTTHRGLRMAVVGGALALILPTGLVFPLCADDEPAAGAKEQTKLAKDLFGAWILVGTPDNVGEAPKSGGRIK